MGFPSESEESGSGVTKALNGCLNHLQIIRPHIPRGLFRKTSKAGQFNEKQGRPVSPCESLLLPETQDPIHAVSDSSIEFATAQSPFFSKLPLQIRIKVYQYAFGNRTFHMDLSFTGPIEQISNGSCHAGINAGVRLRSRPGAGPQKWRWSGNICHRNPEWPWCTDTCQQGTAICRRLSRYKSPEDCFVGVVGWLRSCRQAYMESIEILYSNVFFVESPTLIRFYPQLLPPSHLAYMKGLIIRIDPVRLFTKLRISKSEKRSVGWPGLSNMTATLGSGYFKGLHELDFLLIDHTSKSKPLISREIKLLNKILAIFDDLYIKLSSATFQHLTLHLSLPLLRAAIEITGEREPHIHEDRTLVVKRYWRPVRVGRSDDKHGKSGYWLAEGGYEADLLARCKIS